MTTQTKRVPLSACQLRSGPFMLAAGDAAGDAEKAVPPVARILARSGLAIEHWYWGRLCHDLNGMEQVKDRLPLDYCHDPADLVGYAEGWQRDSGDLTCDGTLLVDQSERARQVVEMAKAGVPYEASISFTPISVEELYAGQSATVNGRLVEGPAAIVRRWRLTGLAVCPRGADPNTKTELSASAGDVEITIHQPTPEAPMSTTEPKTPAAIAAELKADHAAFRAKYGEDLAAQWGPLGECELSIESVGQYVQRLREGYDAKLALAAQEHDGRRVELQQQLETATAKVTDLEARLAAVQLGEPAAASTVPATVTPKEEVELRSSLTPNLAKYVVATRAAKK